MLYRDRFAIRFARGQAILILFLAFIVGASSGHSHGEPVWIAIRVACGVVVVASGVWLRYGIRHIASLEATTQGVTVGVFRRRFIAWAEIERFKAVRRSGIYPNVYLETTAGDLVSARMVQGRKMFWDGEASKDIVGVLNAELASSRANAISGKGLSGPI
ncbi:MAG: PH domain-containing protein [Solirubrobacteraceae bacterium]